MGQSVQSPALNETLGFDSVHVVGQLIGLTQVLDKNVTEGEKASVVFKFYKVRRGDDDGHSHHHELSHHHTGMRMETRLKDSEMVHVEEKRLTGRASFRCHSSMLVRARSQGHC